MIYSLIDVKSPSQINIYFFLYLFFLYPVAGIAVNSAAVLFSCTTYSDTYIYWELFTRELLLIACFLHKT